MASIAISKPTQAWAAVALVTVAATTTPIFIRFAQAEGVPSLSIVTLRLIVGTLVLAPFVWQRHAAALKTLSYQDWLWALTAGAFHAFGLFLLFFALENTSILVSSVLRRTSPLWTIILEIVVLHAAFSRRVWWGLTLTLVGSAVVALGGAAAFEVGQRPYFGAGLSLLNAVTISCYLIIGRKLRDKLPFLAYTWVLFAAATVVAVVFLIFTRTSLLGYSAHGYLWVLVITLVAQLAGHLPINFAIRHFPATYLSVLMQFSVAASAVMAVVYFHEIPTWLQISGSGIIVLGVWMVTRKQ
ncbi:MAG: DMT family transporter [Ardenticatenaceae bacterium]|nr:DMT family transporter [Anaerolineales bacterium]MCB8922013.1 DMT family transporter [Ardenticatenaceae bacterium]MCB8989589.1 DMT family transporter [Ardenticatenaceae bacterium]MCB9003132.1 DMT family transporter [Ardenticatenaceae bacterium]